MNVVMVNPPWSDDDRIGFRSNVRWPFTVSRDELARTGAASYHFPLYQAYALAVLAEDGHDVAAIDCTALDLDVTELINRITGRRPDIVVVEISTPSFTTDIKTVAEIADRVHAPIILIGTHATVFDRDIIETYPCVDAIARGEYEYTLRDIVRATANGTGLAGLPGVTRRDGEGRAVREPDRPFIDNLDEMPIPARDLFPWDKYHEPNPVALPWITMISSRGCPNRCTFCNWPQTMYGHGYRTRSPENVVDEMEFCIDKYRPGEIFFDDDTFTIGHKRVIAICDEIKRRNLDIVWTCMGRVDTVDTEMLRKMRTAGCRRIKFGVETGSPEIMKRIRKKIDLGKVHTAFEAAVDAGIEVHGTYMVGLPGETRQTVRETIELACSLPQDSVQFSIATPFPGTEFFDECERNGWLVTHDWNHFDGRFGAVVSYPQLSKREIEDMLAMAEREYMNRTHPRSLIGKFTDLTRQKGLISALRRTSEYLRTRRNKT
ncbi:MAG: radical SAM protein [Candidatus Hydrogenedentes bacterium]|nr:radical SAM protein [Candidatus Hydrogenedentota bacterium]